MRDRIRNKLSYLRIILIAGFLVGSVTEPLAQHVTGGTHVSRIMGRIPDSLTSSVHDLSDYINTHFTAQKDKSRAISIWIHRNIKYNFDSILTNSLYETPAEVSRRILKTRTGVCLNFAHLFNEMANSSGIKSYVVHGYTKQNGRVDFLPHVWCAALIDTTWFLFDPTWKIGRTKPKNLMTSHIPFDPLWQLLNSDSIQVWENLSEIDKAIASARRIEQRGVRNNFIDAKLRVLYGDIEYFRNKAAAEKYAMAVEAYNAGIQSMNEFIRHLNNRPESGTDSLHLVQLLDSTDFWFNSAMEKLKGTTAPDENIRSSILRLENEIISTMMKLKLQKASFIIHSKEHFQTTLK